jgi:hypothetical protein
MNQALHNAVNTLLRTTLETAALLERIAEIAKSEQPVGPWTAQRVAALTSALDEAHKDCRRQLDLECLRRYQDAAGASSVDVNKVSSRTTNPKERE